MTTEPLNLTKAHSAHHNGLYELWLGDSLIAYIYRNAFNDVYLTAPNDNVDSMSAYTANDGRLGACNGVIINPLSIGQKHA